MIYALVMLITINGHTDRYVIDQAQTAGDCATALSHTHAAQLVSADGIRAGATFRCEVVKH